MLKMKILCASRLYLMMALLISVATQVIAQQWELQITDNLARMNMEQRYRITPDSLFVTGKSDYGRTEVDYLRRALSMAEKKALGAFVKAFPEDSLSPVYFNDYSNFTQIDENNFPRSITLNMRKGDAVIQSKATNAWVGLYDRIFNAVNPILPEEVKIRFDRARFNVFY